MTIDDGIGRYKAGDETGGPDRSMDMKEKPFTTTAFLEGNKCDDEADTTNYNTGAYLRGTSKFQRGLAIMMVVMLVLFGTLRIGSFSCSEGGVAAPVKAGTFLTKYAASTAAPLLTVFQIYPPVLTANPEGVLEITDGSSLDTVALTTQSSTCWQTLEVHSYAYSYGTPYVGTYEPPSCTFNRVSWNLTVTSAGVQYDRLGIVYLGDTEVFRTTTAEPTSNGVEWTYLKDMTNYLSLFKTTQKLIFELDNIVDSTYTGAYNVTLTAEYLNASDSIVPADLILPVSAGLAASDEGSVFTVPSDSASSLLTLPVNTRKAVFTVSATGQSDEEFWWSNVLQSEVNTFPSDGTLDGYSPFREVQVLIDDELAGVAWPFPVIFTGGVVPGLWRPIVGIDVFDLKEDEIDITPWLGVLCDGNSHNFTIVISGLNDNGNGTATLSGTTDSYWLVTGKVFIWLDKDNHTTTGTKPTRYLPDPIFTVSSSVGAVNGTNETLVYQVNAERSLSISSTIHTSEGSQSVFWKQDLTFSNFGNLTDQGNVEINVQNTEGYDSSSSGYAKHFEYPLYALSTYTTFEDNYTIAATINRGKIVDTVGQPVFPDGLESFSVAKGIQSVYPSFEGAYLSTTQNGTASYIANETLGVATSFGTTEQDMVFAGVQVGASRNAQGFPSITGTTELFHRYALAVNSTVIEDEETLIGDAITHEHNNMGSTSGYAKLDAKKLIGHER